MPARTTHRATSSSFLRFPAGAVRAAAFLVAGAIVAASAVVLGISGAQTSAVAAGTDPTTFRCSVGTGYVFSAPSGTTASSMNTATIVGGRYTVGSTPTTLPYQVNAVGFNPNDGFMYGMQTVSSDTSNQFVRIGANGAAQLLGVPADGSTGDNNYDGGVVTTDKGGQPIWIGFLRTNGNLSMTKIAIPTGSGSLTSTSVTKVALTGVALADQPRDVAFNPANGLMYTLQADGSLYSITMDGVVAKIPGVTTSTKAFAGGAWSDSFGNLYFYQNPAGGHVWEYTTAGQMVDLGSTPSAYSFFDATSCLPIALQKTASTATVRPGQEITFSFHFANPYVGQATVESFTDRLPTGSGLTWEPSTVTPASPGGGTVAVSGDTLTVSHIALPSITTGTLDFSATARLTGTTSTNPYTNIANASYTNPATQEIQIQSDDPASAGATDGTTFAVVATPPTATADTVTTTQNTAAAPFDPTANDTAAAAGVTLVPTATRLLDPTTSTYGTTATTSEGTYVVDTATGLVTYTPAQGFSGAGAKPVTYRVTDSNGATATSTIAPAVTKVVPTANPDTGTTTQGTAVTVTPASNDTAGNTRTPLVASSVTLQPLSSGGSAASGGKSLTVPGEGTYTVADDGDVTFTPLSTFSGTAMTIGYTIEDRDGGTASSSITVTVTGVAPAPVADTATTEQNTPVALTPASNDRSGAVGGTPIDPESIRLVDPATGDTTTNPVTVTGGTFTVATASGVVTFTPTEGFSGPSATIGYQVSDTDGRTAQSTMSVTVERVLPTAEPDTATTSQGTTVTLTPSGNDTAGNSRTPLDPTSVTLQPGRSGGTLSDGGTALVVRGEGRYSVAGDGTVTFVPEPSFAGSTTAIAYTITDVDGGTATSTISIDVTPVGPTATPDAATTSQNTAITLTPASNDLPGVAGGTPIDPTSVVLIDPATGVRTTDPVTVTGGTFGLDPTTGLVTFTPAAGFSGSGPTVRYQVSDTRGLTAVSHLDVTVTPVAPTAPNGRATTLQGAAVTLQAPTGSTPGNANTPIDPTTVQLREPVGTDAVLSADGGTLTVTGEGTWRVQRDGSVVFAPLASFTGPTTRVPYTIADVDGTTATADLRVQVTPVPPRAVADTGRTVQNVPVTIDPLTNDAPGIVGGSALDRGSVVLLANPGDTVGSTRLTTTEGTFTVVSDGHVTFTPVAGYAGTTAPVPYRVTDAAGATATGTITIVVDGVLPAATDDTTTTRQDTPVAVQPLGNDRPGNTATPLDATSVVLRAVAGSTLAADGRSLAVPGQGSYRVDSTTGIVTFTPVKGFHGTTTPVPYSVSDVDEGTAGATITVTVTPVAPAASNDLGSTRQGTATTVDVLGNDRAGGVMTPIDRTSVRLTTTGLTGATLSADARTLTIPGQGVYTVDRTTGAITFTPTKTFTGAATTITYEVADVDGTTTTATLGMSVASTATVARPDTASGVAGRPIRIDPLSNDSSPTGAALDPSTVTLISPNAASTLSEDGHRLVVPGEGVWTVDSVTGIITFTPDEGFSGTATPVQYSVMDADGVRVVSSIAVTVDPTAAPAALAFTGSETTGPVIAALLLLLLGFGVALVARRRPVRRSTWRRH